MQHFFRSWESFSSDIRAASHTLLLSDCDGTLIPIVSRSAEAILSLEVKVMIGIEGIYYTGNHGLEIEGLGLKLINPATEAARDEMKGNEGKNKKESS